MLNGRRPGSDVNKRGRRGQRVREGAIVSVRDRPKGGETGKRQIEV